MGKINTAVIAGQTEAGLWAAGARLAMPLDEWNALDVDKQDELRDAVRESVKQLAPHAAEIKVGVHYV